LDVGVIADELRTAGLADEFQQMEDFDMHEAVDQEEYWFRRKVYDCGAMKIQLALWCNG
jgi:hypothetical protein